MIRVFPVLASVNIIIPSFLFLGSHISDTVALKKLHIWQSFKLLQHSLNSNDISTENCTNDVETFLVCMCVHIASIQYEKESGCKMHSLTKFVN